MTESYENTVASFSGEEIAVDLPYAELVDQTSERHSSTDEHYRGKMRDTEPRLGLALIALDPDHIAGAIRTKYEGKFTERPGTTLSTLDYIIDGVRIGLGEKFGGWFPPMGKNRDSDTIGGLPHIDTGKMAAGWEFPKTADDHAPIPKFVQPPNGAQEVRVGVIDGQLYQNHDLDFRWYTLDPDSAFPTTTTEFSWLQGHSVFVAGKILEQAPAAKLEFYGALKGTLPSANVWSVAKAMANFVDNGVKILNLSIGCYARDGKAPFVLARAMEVLTGKGVLIVAAAGNHGAGDGKIDGIEPNAPIYPAALPNVIAVGAVEPNDTAGFHAAPFSPQAPWINLVAPGYEVTSTYLSAKVTFTKIPGQPGLAVPEPTTFAGYASWSGTSFATATVSGEIAKRVSEGKTPQQALDEIRMQEPTGHGGIGRYTRP